jgi:hypothetical protein
VNKFLLTIFGLAGVGLFVALLAIIFDFILWLVITIFVLGAAAITLSTRNVDWRRTWRYRVRLFIYRHL